MRGQTRGAVIHCFIKIPSWVSGHGWSKFGHAHCFGYLLLQHVTVVGSSYPAKSPDVKNASEITHFISSGTYKTLTRSINSIVSLLSDLSGAPGTLARLCRWNQICWLIRRWCNDRKPLFWLFRTIAERLNYSAMTVSWIPKERVRCGESIHNEENLSAECILHFRFVSICLRNRLLVANICLEVLNNVFVDVSNALLRFSVVHYPYPLPAMSSYVVPTVVVTTTTYPTMQWYM